MSDLKAISTTQGLRDDLQIWWKRWGMISPLSLSPSALGPWTVGVLEGIRHTRSITYDDDVLQPLPKCFSLGENFHFAAAPFVMGNGERCVTFRLAREEKYFSSEEEEREGKNGSSSMRHHLLSACGRRRRELKCGHRRIVLPGRQHPNISMFYTMPNTIPNCHMFITVFKSTVDVY